MTDLAILWHAVTAPFPLVLIGLAAAACITADIETNTRRRPPAPPHGHYFRRHPSGPWRCACGATRDRNGRPVS